jgi:signal peptidase I
MNKIPHKQRQPSPLKRPLVRVVLIVVALYLAFAGFMKVFLPTYRIPASGMDPTVHLGDHVVASRFAYRWPTGRHRGSPSRWDMVTFRAGSDSFMQRVAALPGETVVIRGKQLFVDGRAIADPFAAQSDSRVYPNSPALPQPYRNRDWFGPLKLGPGRYFLLGDNRDRSFDSRYRGPIEEGQIIGRVIYVHHGACRASRSR